jgi:hypothetical protein
MNYAKALKNKVRSAMGAPGRAMVNRKVQYNQAKSDREVGFLKDYNAKDKRGAPISPQDRARFEMIKNRN